MLFLSIDLQSFSQQINENGFTIFVSGILFTMSLYHFLLFFQHKDKSYLYYSLYTFFVFLHSYYRVDSFFIKDILTSYTPYIQFLHASIKWLYATFYLLFAIYFINLEKYNPKWNRIIKKTIGVSFSFVFITSVLSLLYNDIRITEYAFNFLFMFVLFTLSIVVLILLKNVKSVVKNYLFLGFSVFLLFAIITQSLDFMGYSFRIIFYTGIIFEATLFALGLGYKQKKLLLDKITAQNKEIEEHMINLNLKEKIEKELDQEVAEKTKEIIALTQRKEVEHKKKLALDYSKKTINLRMRALQTQMNPHFLFNSLNSIKHFIIKNEKEDASFFLGKLSKLIRKILDNSQLVEITLKEELAIMQLYLNVENIRLDNDILLDIVIEKSLQTENYKLPPMVLQPFIENAIWHGLALKKGDKKIEIHVKKTADNLIITIADNGIGREKAAVLKAAKLVEKESLGIELTKQRLEAYTQHLSGQSSIVFEDLYDLKSNPTGTKVHITIPVFSTKNNPVRKQEL